jgi:spore coat protein U-like protein
MIKVLAGVIACAFATAPAALAAGAPRPAPDGLTRTLLSCAATSAGTLRFGSMTMAGDRATFSAPLTVRCDENATYRVRLTSANECRLLGPRADGIRYAIYTDAGHRQGALDCSAGPLEIAGHGTMTFHLYGETAPLINAAAGAYADSVSVQVILDSPSGGR